ncbi:MAG: MFS transporter [Planctomycetota bacterium]|nr:MAG: MFS transporter [Planctomycetota bacterium]
MAQWIDRVGAKRMWGLGFVIFSAASLANLGLDGLGPAIYLLRCSILLGAALVFASSLCYVSQIAPPSRRTEAIGLLGVGGFLGMLVGPLLGDLFLGTGQRSREDFAALFIAAAVANLVPLLLLTKLRSPEMDGPVRSVRLTDFIRTVWRYWPGAILLVDFAFGVAMTCPLIFLASFIDQAPLQMGNLSMLGVFFTCYAGWAIALRIGMRRWPEVYGPRPVLIGGMLFMALAMFAFLLVDASRPWLLLLPAVLGGTGHALTFHTMTSLTLDPFPPQYRGTASALALMMLDMGTFVGAPVLGKLGQVAGFNSLFAAVGVTCLGATWIYARCSR